MAKRLTAAASILSCRLRNSRDEWEITAVGGGRWWKLGGAETGGLLKYDLGRDVPLRLEK